MSVEGIYLVMRDILTGDSLHKIASVKKLKLTMSTFNFNVVLRTFVEREDVEFIKRYFVVSTCYCGLCGDSPFDINLLLSFAYEMNKLDTLNMLYEMGAKFSMKELVRYNQILKAANTLSEANKKIFINDYIHFVQLEINGFTYTLNELNK